MGSTLLQRGFANPLELTPVSFGQNSRVGIERCLGLGYGFTASDASKFSPEETSKYSLKDGNGMKIRSQGQVIEIVVWH